MAATDVTSPPTSPLPPRRRPVTSRVSSGHVLTVAAALLAAVLNFAVLRGGDGEVPVVVATADIPAGAALDAADFRTVPGRLDPTAMDGLLAADQLSHLDGHVAAVPIPAGAPVRRADIVEASSADLGGRRISIPVERDHAVGGRIAPEDRIDVIRVLDGVATYLVSGARVLDVADGTTPGFGALGEFHVTIAVDAETALCLASAIDAGGLTVVLSTGQEPVAVTPCGDGSGSTQAGVP